MVRSLSWFLALLTRCQGLERGQRSNLTRGLRGKFHISRRVFETQQKPPSWIKSSMPTLQLVYILDQIVSKCDDELEPFRFDYIIGFHMGAMRFKNSDPIEILYCLNQSRL